MPSPRPGSLSRKVSPRLAIPACLTQGGLLQDARTRAHLLGSPYDSRPGEEPRSSPGGSWHTPRVALPRMLRSWWARRSHSNPAPRCSGYISSYPGQGIRGRERALRQDPPKRRNHWLATVPLLGPPRRVLLVHVHERSFPFLGPTSVLLGVLVTLSRPVRKDRSVKQVEARDEVTKFSPPRGLPAPSGLFP